MMHSPTEHPKQQQPTDDPVADHATWGLWPTFVVISAIGAIFALLVALDMTAAIGMVAAILVLIGAQAVLLAYVWRSLTK